MKQNNGILGTVVGIIGILILIPLLLKVGVIILSNLFLFIMVIIAIGAITWGFQLGKGFDEIFKK